MAEKIMNTGHFTKTSKYTRLEDFVIERIDDLRKINGLSKYRVGIMTGIAQSSLSTMTSGKTSPSLGTLDRFCEGLGISIFEFFDIDEEKVVCNSREGLMLKYWSQLDKQHKVMAAGYIQGLIAASGSKVLDED